MLLVKIAATILAIAFASVRAVPAIAADSICTGEMTDIDFGHYIAHAARQTTFKASLAIRCTGPNEALTVSLVRSASGASGMRSMTGTRASLGYGLYVDPARQIAFGDGSGGTSVVRIPAGVIGAGRPWMIPVYGSVFGGQFAAAGAYTDSVVAKIEATGASAP
jgi:spore coat protein U-like protein